MIGHTGLGKNSKLRLVMGNAQDFENHGERFTNKAKVTFDSGDSTFSVDIWYGLETLYENRYHQVPYEAWHPEWRKTSLEFIKAHYVTRPALFEVTVEPYLELVEASKEHQAA